jgi:hypothetical protein
MNIRTVIINGNNEHPCWQDDNGKCLMACPCRVTFEGHLVQDASLLGRPTEPNRCAIGIEGKEIREL